MKLKIPENTLLALLWQWKGRILVIWFAVVILTVVRLLLMDNIYTSDCTLALLPPERVTSSGQMGGTGGSVLGQLMGNFGGASDVYASVAYMKSRPILDAVIDTLDLKPLLFHKKWDKKLGAWKKGEVPTDWKARSALSRRVDVNFDEYTGLVTLAVHWPDPSIAHAIATEFLSVSNAMLQGQALEEGQRRVAELYKESAAVAYPEVGAQLSEEITTAISRLASIRARTDYAFRVVNPPIVPEEKSWPPRTLILLAVGAIAGLVELGVVVGIYLRQRAEAPPSGA